MQETAVVRGRSGVIGYAAAKWAIFAVMILTYILVYFHRMAPGVVADYLMSAFQSTGAALGTLSAIYFIVYACMQIPSGVIADTLGTRTSIIGGNLVAGFGSICFGLADTFFFACLGRFLVGLGVSVVFVSIMKSNSVWFHERVFAVMSGLTLLIGNLGSVMAAAPLSAMLSLVSWRSIFIGIGLLSLLLALAGFLLVRNRPEDLGFPSPNEYGASGAKHANWMRSLSSVITVWRIWPGFWVQFGMIGGLYAFMGLWGMPYLKDVFGLSRGVAANYITAMLLSFAVGALFFGWFSDRVGRRKPILIACVAAYALSWLLLMYAPWRPGLSGYLLFASMGLAGSGFVLTFASAKEVIDPRLSGMAVSVVNCGCFLGTALMQPLFGYVADRSWDGRIVEGLRIYSASDYHNGFIAMLAFAAIAVAGSLRLTETCCRNIAVQWASGSDGR